MATSTSDKNSSNASTGSSAVVCPDRHQCMSGSTCVEFPNEEGHYYCNCSSWFDNDLYAGVSCEYKATAYCSSKSQPEWFCTNHGKCTMNTRNGYTMFQCQCPKGYEGDRCQYVSGSKPAHWPEDAYAYAFTPTPINYYPPNAGATIALLVVLLLAMISLIGAVICYLCRAGKQQETPSSTTNLEDLTMEVGDDVIVANVAGEGAEASFPHPDEIKSNDTIGARPPTVHRAEVKVRENEEDEGEDATNEII